MAVIGSGELSLSQSTGSGENLLQSKQADMHHRESSFFIHTFPWAINRIWHYQFLNAGKAVDISLWNGQQNTPHNGRVDRHQQRGPTLTAWNLE